MSTDERDPGALLSREELIALVKCAHMGSASADDQRASATLAAHSRLPKRVAENLGAGFGQWGFFPEISDIVDFAVAYVPPTTQEQLWALARTWAADDAAARHTLMALVGRDILDHELRRIDVPSLREVVDEHRPTRARELRMSLGLDAPPLAPAKAAAGPRRSTQATKGAPAAPKREITTRMPKPEFRAPAKPAPAPEAKRYRHPKFGDGVLRAQDGAGPEAKLTIEFATGPKTLLARFVTELLP
jgi:hypothetical protein